MNVLSPQCNDTLRFLVPTDFSAGAEKALLHGLSLAHQFEAEIHLLHIVTRPATNGSIPAFPDVEAYEHHQEGVALQHLRRLAETTQQSGVRVQPVLRCSDDVATSILDYAGKHTFALIVMGTHAHQGGIQAPLGRTAEQVVRCARGPVLTVAPHVEVIPGFIQNVLVSIDFSEPARHALMLANEMARHQKAHLTLFHVIEPARQCIFYDGHVTELATRASMTTQEAHEALRRLPIDETGLLDVKTSVVQGAPGTMIVTIAGKLAAHLIVQGAHGHTDIDHLELGQVAEEVIRTAHCPVLTVKRVLVEANV